MTKISTVFLACIGVVSGGAALAQVIASPDLTAAIRSISSSGDRRVELGAMNPNGLGGLNLQASSGAAMVALKQAAAPDPGAGLKIREAPDGSTNPMAGLLPTGLTGSAMMSALGSGGADAVPPVQVLIGMGSNVGSMASLLVADPPANPVKLGQ